MGFLNKTSITAMIGVLLGVLVSVGVIGKDVADAALEQAVRAVELVVGLVAVLMSLLHLFQRRATQKLQYRMEQSTLLAAPPGTLPRELQP